MNTFAMSLPRLVVNLQGSRGGHCCCEQGRPLWSHATSRHPAGAQTEREPHRSSWWAAARRAPRRTPGPSPAGHRSYRQSSNSRDWRGASKGRVRPTRQLMCPMPLCGRLRSPDSAAISLRHVRRRASAVLLGVPWLVTRLTPPDLPTCGGMTGRPCQPDCCGHHHVATGAAKGGLGSPVRVTVLPSTRARVRVLASRR